MKQNSESKRREILGKALFKSWLTDDEEAPSDNICYCCNGYIWRLDNHYGKCGHCGKRYVYKEEN